MNRPQSQPSGIAPDLDVVSWLNTDRPLSLSELRGQIVLLHAFQMLCPACVSHGLPQASAVHRRSLEGVMVIGLHTVFEHHAVMGVEALTAFAHEYRLQFPIGVDRPSTDGPVPQTMRRYSFRGTPSLALIDHRGQLRMSHFGHVDDLSLGLMLGRLLHERERDGESQDGCTAEGCPVPGSVGGEADP